MNRKSRGLCGIWLLGAVIIAGCGGKSSPPPAPAKRPSPAESPIVLEIEEISFNRNDFYTYLASRYPDLKLDRDHPELLSRLFDSFAEYQILRYRAEQAGVCVSADELPELSEKLLLPSDSLPRPILMETARIQKYLYFNYFRQQEVTDSEIAAYYSSHREKFRMDAEVHLYQILLADKDKAIELRGILQNTPDRFEELARERSISPEAVNNGFMGTFEKGTLPAEMENVVFSLPPNQISPVVESKFGYHIFKVTSRSGQRTLPLQRVREQIRMDLMSDKLRLAYETMLAEARESLQIRFKTENLDFTYTTQRGEEADETDHENSSAPDGAVAHADVADPGHRSH